MVDLFLVYSFIRKLVTPFNKWEAFKLGIIDEKGNVLIKRKEFSNSKQSKAFGIFDVMLLNLKKLLAKVPGGQSKLASYAAGAVFDQRMECLPKRFRFFVDRRRFR